MKIESYIPIEIICQYHDTDMSVIESFHEIGLIEIVNFEDRDFIHKDALETLEKLLRMHDQLGINTEGLEVVTNLLLRIEELRREVTALRNRIPSQEGFMSDEEI
jgi:hypothetical protein